MKKSPTNDKSPTRDKRSAGKRGADRPSSGDSEPSARNEAEPIRRDEEVQENNDEHIDQDFPGYPHHPSRNPRTIHNGSAGAFDATEHSHDEEDEDQDSDDFAMDR